MFSVNFSITAMQSTSKNNVSIASNTIPTIRHCLVDFVSCIFTLIFTWNYTLYLFLGHSVHLESWHLLHLRSQAWNQIYKGQRTRHVIWAQKTKTMIQNADHRNLLKNCSCACKTKNSSTDNANTTIIWCIQLQQNAQNILEKTSILCMYCMYMWLAQQILKEK